MIHDRNMLDGECATTTANLFGKRAAVQGLVMIHDRNMLDGECATTTANPFGKRAAVRGTGKSWCRSPRHPLQGVDKPQHRSPERSRVHTMQTGIVIFAYDTRQAEQHRHGQGMPQHARNLLIALLADEGSPTSSGQGAIM